MEAIERTSSYDFFRKASSFAVKYQLITVIRLLVAISLWIIPYHYYSDWVSNTVWFSLIIAFGIYSLLLLLLSSPAFTRSNKSLFIYFQIGIDILFITFFCIISKNPNSNFFLLYLLPLMLASKVFRFEATLRIFILILILYTSVTLTTSYTNEYGVLNSMLNIILKIFFATLLLLYLAHYRYRYTDNVVASKNVTHIISNIQNEDNLKTLLNNVSKQAAILLGGDSAGVLLVEHKQLTPKSKRDKAPKKLRFHGAYELSDYTINHTCDIEGQSVAGRVLLDRKLRIEHNIPESKIFYNPAAKKESFKSIISTPLIVSGEVIGTLDVHSKSNLFAFSEEKEGILLKLVAEPTAIAIAKLRKQEFINSLLENAFSAIIAVDQEGHIIEFNRYAEETTGYKKEEVLNKDVDEIYYTLNHAKTVMKLLREKSTLNQLGILMDHKTFLKSSDGTKIPIRLSASMIENGSVGFFRNAFTDYYTKKMRDAALSILQNLHDYQDTLNAITRIGIEFMEDETEISQKSLVSPKQGATNESERERTYFCGLLLEKKNRLHCVSTQPPNRLQEFRRNFHPIDLSTSSPNKLGLAGIAFNENRVINEKNTRKSKYYIPSNPSTRSQLSVPIRINKKPVGILILESSEPDAFSAHDENLLKFLAGFAGVAIQNGKRIDQLKNVRAAVRKITSFTISNPGDTNTLNEIASEVKNALESDLVTIHILENENSEYKYQFGSCGLRNPNYLPDKKVVFWTNDLYSELDKNNIYCYQHGQSDAILNHSFTKEERLRTCVAVPLRIFDRGIGVMVVGYRQFTELNNTEDFLLFADQTAISIETKNLFTNLQSAENLATFGLLYGEDLHLSANKLGAASQFAKSIIDHAQTLKEAQNDAILIYNNIQNFLDLIRANLANVRPPEARTFDLVKCIKDVIESSPTGSDINTKYSLEQEKYLIMGLKRQVSQIFRVIVHNAVAAMEGKGVLSIEIRNILNQKNFVKIRIADTGPGVPKSKLPNLFKLKHPHLKKKGFGIGLAWANYFLTYYGGSIKLASNSSEGAIFEVIIPKHHVSNFNKSLFKTGLSNSDILQK